MELKVCIAEYCVVNPYLVLLIIPIFIVLLLILKHTFIDIKDKAKKEEFVKNKKSIRTFLLVTRTLIFLFLLMALATPYTEKQITTQGSPSLTILTDNSTSFNLFDKNIVDDVSFKLKQRIPVNTRYIAIGEKSAIGDGILASMQGGDNLLVISDGNNNHGRVLGDVITFASQLNTSVSTLNIKPVKKDVSVSIEGPHEVIDGEENTYTVKVTNVGNLEYMLYVEIDGQKLTYEKNKKTFSFKNSFKEGYHRIKATVTVEDYFSQNNVYYKSIKSVEKPKILFVSEKTSPMLGSLSNIYGIVSSESIESNLDDYYAVILNDLSGDSISDHLEDLTAYVADGNGLVVIGGKNSYDKGFYDAKLIESLLPVEIGIPEMSEKQNANIVFLIDVSDTTANPFKGSAGSSVLDYEKAIALNLIETLRLDDKVGVIALHATSRLVSSLEPLIDSKEKLVSDMKKMQPGGGTNFVPALRRAAFMMEGQTGSKNIILITDGIEYSTRAATISTVASLAENGVSVHTVGIGQFTDELHLRTISETGKGLYFKPDETQQLNLLFSRPSVESTEEDGKRYSLLFLDKNHWITSGNISVKGMITGFNYVTPKIGSRPLVITNKGNPIITVGRFGLGRVVAFATDDGSGWAGQLLSSTNSKVITRTINWAIGDLARKKDFDITIKDIPANKPAEIVVYSDKFPQSDLPFSKVGDNVYVAEQFSENLGFNTLLGATFAVNYNDEYLDIGFNEEFKEAVTITGGRIFDPDDIDGIVEHVKTFSKRTSTEVITLMWPFVLVALLIFLLDIIVRRIKEYKFR